MTHHNRGPKTSDRHRRARQDKWRETKALERLDQIREAVLADANAGRISIQEALRRVREATKQAHKASGKRA